MADSATPWRLGTVGSDASPRTVLESDGRLYELDRLLAGAAIRTPTAGTATRELLGNWDAWRPILAAIAESPGTEPLDEDGLKWLPPVPNPSKIVCAGANYGDHLAEMGDEPTRTERPFAFIKPSNTLLGHRRPLVLPAMAHKVDWEGELSVVIGRVAKHVRGEQALAAIAGYCPFNDVSARDWIDKPVLAVGMDWIVHKSFDGFGPMGPLMTPAEFVGDPQRLQIRLAVNGVVKQDASTSHMLWGVLDLIEYLSTVMTLFPGDVISTGSPSGVGHGRGEYLAPGDAIALSIGELGPALETPVFALAG
jgi:2,4-didehydro-3-deoxy-L-rhamnonate hydrolase